jgi:hypothetical protein
MNRITEQNINSDGRRLLLNSESGSIMAVMLVIFFLTTILCMGILAISANSVRLANMQRQGAEAFNIAESGAGLAVEWLSLQAFPPTGLNAFSPTFNGTNVGAGSFSVTIYPDSGNNINYLKTYRIVSKGTSGAYTKTVEVVWRQGSFGRFAYFTDSEKSSTGTTIWWKAGELCDGPAFSNNTGGTNFQINYSGSTAPIFTNYLMAAGSSINYSPTTPTTTSAFNDIYSNGAKGYMLSMAPIALPATSSVQQTAAWGASSGYPTTTGVYLRSGSGGGIYICGDSTVQLARTSTGAQQVIVKQGTNTTTITTNISGSSVTTSGPLGTGSSTGMGVIPNGVIYSSGNITSLSGTVTDNVVSSGVVTTRSAWTIATDVANSKDITITGNLLYNTMPDKTQLPNAACNLAAGTLGLVARNINIASTAPANLTIDAVCMAGGSNTTAGSFSAVNYDTRTPVGTLNVLGGIIQKYRGAVGTFNASTGATTTGYTKSYSYDPRMATDPPPYYPTTSTYSKLSWRVIANQ